MRALEPDETGFVERDDVRVYWERFGDGSPTVLLLPPWSIVHSRAWKAQIPYFARHHRVVVFDPRGNGRSSRPADPAAYAEAEFAADTLAVMDASGTDAAVFVCWSRAAQRGLLVATECPDRVLGMVFLGASLPLAPELEERDDTVEAFRRPRERYEDWGKWNMNYWLRDYRGFVEFFVGRIFTEPHSTKQFEDSVGWGLDTDAETLVATALAPPFADLERTEGLLATLTCPVLVIHGEEDAIRPVRIGRRIAEITGGRFVCLPGCGHGPNARKPVLFNNLVKDFIDREARSPPALAGSLVHEKGDL